MHDHFTLYILQRKSNKKRIQRSRELDKKMKHPFFFGNCGSIFLDYHTLPYSPAMQNIQIPLKA